MSFHCCVQRIKAYRKLSRPKSNLLSDGSHFLASYERKLCNGTYTSLHLWFVAARRKLEATQSITSRQPRQVSDSALSDPHNFVTRSSTVAIDSKRDFGITRTFGRSSFTP